MIEKVLVPEVQEFLKRGNLREIKELLAPEHPEDIATLISELDDLREQTVVFRVVPSEKFIDVFEYLEPDVQQEILRELSSVTVKRLLNEMAPDERTELLEELPGSIVKQFLGMLSPEDRRTATEILGYPEGSVGRLITPEYVQLYEEMTVREALDQIREVGLTKETVYHCYVLDRGKVLRGVVSLRTLVVSAPAEIIKNLMKREVICVSAATDREEAANIFKRYDLIALPVVDNQGKLVGIVTFDDFVDVLEEEATEDFERFAAVLPGDYSYLDTPVLRLFWQRSVWLILLVLLSSISSLVLEHFETTLSRMVALTFFLPVLIGAAGNAGTQSATLVIRGLATGEVSVSDFFTIVLKESLVGVLIGVVLALFGFARAMLQRGDVLLGMSVGIAMGIAVFMATMTGALMPILFQRLRIDPALISGPMLATVADVAGTLIYLGVARVMMGL